MAEESSMWIGKDEHEGVLAQPRKDLKPPPHWRLEAVAHTPRPRSLTIAADRRRAVFIQDARHLRRVAARPRRRRAARAPHDRPRPGAVLGGPRAAPVAGRLAPSPTRTRATCGSPPTAGGPPRKLVEGSRPVWIDADRLVDLRRARRHARAWPSSTAATPGRGGSPPRTATSTSTATRARRWSRPTAARSPTPSRRAPTSTAARSAWRRLDGGDVRALTGTPRMHDTGPAWSPDGASARLHVGAQRLLRGASRGRATAPATGSSRARAPTTASSTGTPTARACSALRCRGNRFDLVIVDAETGDAETVAEGGVWCTPLWTAAGEIVAGYEDHATPPRAAPARGAGGPPATLHAPAPMAVRSAPHAALEDVRYPSFDGLEIPAFLMRPRDASADSPVPAVVYPHGGPTDALRRRVGRPRPVLRRPRLRLARPELPRLHRLRPRLRARQPRRVGRRRHQGLPGRGGLPAHARLGRRRPAGDLRGELRLLHGAARGDRRSRAPLPLRRHASTATATSSRRGRRATARGSRTSSA